MRNPFENHGRPVCGEEFIGRENAVQLLRQRVVDPRIAGCAGVYGQPRVGKTSVARQLLLKYKEPLAAAHKIPISVSMNAAETAEDFFFTLVEQLKDESVRRGLLLPDIDILAGEAQRQGPGSLSRLETFFGSYLDSGHQPVIVVDDFDGAARVFKNRPDCFEKMRVLGSDIKVAFITLSRRNIYEIEDRATGGSTLAGIFGQHPLGLFDDVDFSAFARLLASSIGSNLSGVEIQVLQEACGSQPHLLAMVASDLVESHLCQGRRSLEQILQSRVTDFLTNFDHTVTALRDDRRLNKVFQILFGPALDVQTEDVTVCVSYGLIRLQTIDVDAGPECLPYSVRFGDYLRSVERRHIEGDVWTVWARTETALRRLVVDTMMSKYGDNWELDLASVNDKRSDMIGRWRASQAREEKALGTVSMNALVDFSHVADLFTLIFDEWSTHQERFGRDQSYWRHRADTLIRVRIALAHNRRVFRNQKERVQEYCEELLTVLQESSSPSVVRKS